MGNSAVDKVSIITCFLNVESYLEEAVDSVLQQEHENWELFLIDDGSTDRSSSIAKAYALRYPEKIKYFEHAGHVNRGASASRNIGIRAATGDLIAFLDADDIWMPYYLRSQVELIHQQAVSMVCQATEYWYTWQDPQRQNIIIPVGTEQDRLYLPPQLALNLYPLGNGAAPCICGMLIKKEAVAKHGGFEESFKGMYDDQVLLTKLYTHEPIYISSVCLNRYRQRPGSLVSSSREADYHAVRKRFLEWFEGYLLSQGKTDVQVEQLLKKALMPYRRPLFYFLKSLTFKKSLSLVKKGFRKLRRKARKYKLTTLRSGS